MGPSKVEWLAWVPSPPARHSNENINTYIYTHIFTHVYICYSCIRIVTVFCVLFSLYSDCKAVFSEKEAAKADEELKIHN
jgi:hypothetical protein